MKIDLEGVGWDLLTALREELERMGAVDTGALKNSMEFRVDQGKLIISMEEYGEYVEFGTKPHKIVAKNGKSLKFKGANGDVFVKSVNHPGTRPKPFIRTTLHQRLAQIIQNNLVE